MGCLFGCKVQGGGHINIHQQEEKDCYKEENEQVEKEERHAPGTRTDADVRMQML